MHLRVNVKRRVCEECCVTSVCMINASVLSKYLSYLVIITWLLLQRFKNQIQNYFRQKEKKKLIVNSECVSWRWEPLTVEIVTQLIISYVVYS